MRMVPAALLLAAVVGLVGGCGYEETITRVEKPGGIYETPALERYGTLRMVWVREMRKPRGLSRFPDGGRALEVALYAVVYQRDPQSEGEREVGRIALTPVRRGDFGNLLDFEMEWLDSQRFHYRVRHGYLGHPRLTRVEEGTMTIPPL